MALGADQIRLPLQGNAANEVLTVNDLEDYARFRQAIAGKKKLGAVKKGDTVVLTSGEPMGEPGGTNTLKIIHV